MKFTIIIPCYNAEKWVEQSLTSALNQTYETEVIFVDNESTDRSLSIAKRIQADHPELKIYSAPNLYDYSWQEPVFKALEHTTGDYWTVLAADDYISADYVQNIVSIISKIPNEVKLLQTPILGVRADGSHQDLLRHDYKSLKEFKDLLFKKCPVNTPSVVYSIDLYKNNEIDWDSEKWVGAGDYNLYFSLAHKGYFIYPIPKWVGYYYRWHPEQSTWGMHKKYSNIDLKLREHWSKCYNKK